MRSLSIREGRDIVRYYAGLSEHIFIHIPRTGGVAIRSSRPLKGFFIPARRHFHRSRQYSESVLTTMRANGEHHGFEHARLRDISLAVRRTHRPFSIVRNPWARVVSRFALYQRTAEVGRVARDYAAATFEGFLEERHVWGNKEFYWHRAIRGWYPQLDYVVDEKGAIGADILRTEHLQDEVSKYFGVPEAVRRRNEGGRKGDYQACYDRRTVQIVADWYAKDIEMFGFDFDTPATRNTFFTERG